MIKKAGVEMDLIQKIRRIEQYVVENFEELDMDDPIKTEANILVFYLL